MTNERALAQGQRNTRAALRADNVPVATLDSAGANPPMTQYRAWTTQCGMPSCAPKYGGWHCLVPLGCSEPEERARWFRKDGHRRHGLSSTWALLAGEDKNHCLPPSIQDDQNNAGVLDSEYLGHSADHSSRRVRFAYNEGPAAQLPRCPSACWGAQRRCPPPLLLLRARY